MFGLCISMLFMVFCVVVVVVRFWVFVVMSGLFSCAVRVSVSLYAVVTFSISCVVLVIFFRVVLSMSVCGVNVGLMSCSCLCEFSVIVWFSLFADTCLSVACIVM